MVNAIGWVALAILAAVLGAEAIAWCGPAHRAMLRMAASALPVEHRDRYLEEWLTELEQVPNGPITRLLWVGGILFRRNSIARALGSPVSASQTRHLLLKSSFDTVAAAVTLVLYAPFLLVIALAIRLESSGPVFFRQYRIGRNGRQFVMLKFRTMMPCAAGSQFVDTIKPSVTRVGRLLRRYSLDELPQLINVARGDMSLVGPRPSLPWEAHAYSSEWPRGLPLKPGVTGLWQITKSSSLTQDEVLQLDLRYARNRSLLVDLAIIFKTLFAAILGDRDRLDQPE